MAMKTEVKQSLEQGCNQLFATAGSGFKQPNEIPVIFECQGQKLVGIVHNPTSQANTGVLIVVGGPQYRVGSHRQFLLLARYLSCHGIPAMRFDVRGMGDSDAAQRQFDELDMDIRSAIDCFMASNINLERVIIWGLCDAASAALFYGYQDRRVAGLVLLNPWVFTEQGAAKTYLKYYYVQRLLSVDFWRKLFAFKFDFIGSVSSITGMLKTAWKQSENISTVPTESNGLVSDHLPLPIRMRECFKRFGKPVLLILSGRDLTADEFRLVAASDSAWQALLNDPQVTVQNFSEADHTFSSAVWRDRVAELTERWVKSIN